MRGLMARRSPEPEPDVDDLVWDGLVIMRHFVYRRGELWVLVAGFPGQYPLEIIEYRPDRQGG